MSKPIKLTTMKTHKVVDVLCNNVDVFFGTYLECKAYINNQKTGYGYEIKSINTSNKSELNDLINDNNSKKL